jgi:uncharacterized RDD family membrane protein YckC
MMERKNYRNIGLAGFWLRLGANLLDGLIISIPLALFWFVVVGFNVDTFDDTTFVPDFIYGIYGLLMPVFWYGFTIGKKICNVRIERIDGLDVTIGTMLLRNLVGGLVYVITLGIAYIVSIFMVALREDKRSIHDLIAGTRVVEVVELTLSDEANEILSRDLNRSPESNTEGPEVSPVVSEVSLAKADVTEENVEGVKEDIKEEDNK